MRARRALSTLVGAAALAGVALAGAPEGPSGVPVAPDPDIPRFGTVSQALDRIGVAEPVSIHGFAVYPLLRIEAPREPLPLAAGPAAPVAVRQTDAPGREGLVRVSAVSALRTLVLGGELLCGEEVELSGDEERTVHVERVLASSVLLPPGASALAPAIPGRCSAAPLPRTGRLSPAAHRFFALTAGSLPDSLSTGRLRVLTRSPGQTLASFLDGEDLRARWTRVESTLLALPGRHAGQMTGYALADRDGPFLAELLGDADAFEAAWPELARSVVAQERLAQLRLREGGPSGLLDPPARDHARGPLLDALVELLRGLYAAPTGTEEAFGLGQEQWLRRGDGTAAYALVHDGRLVHLMAGRPESISLALPPIARGSGGTTGGGPHQPPKPPRRVEDERRGRLPGGGNTPPRLDPPR